MPDRPQRLLRRLLAAFFKLLEGRLARPIHTDDFAAGSQAAELLRAFAGLKLTWPFRRAGAYGAANYFFDDGLYPRPAVARADASIPPSPLEPIFRELDSGFSTLDDLRDAEGRIDGIIDGMVTVVEKKGG